MVIWMPILFTCIVVLGIKVITHKNMGLYSFKVLVMPKLGNLKDPVINCEWCMPSLYSSIGYIFSYFYYGHLEISNLIFYPITIAASSVLCGTSWTIIMILIEYLNLYSENKNNS